MLLTAGSIGVTWLFSSEKAKPAPDYSKFPNEPSYTRLDVLKVAGIDRQIAIITPPQAPDYIDSLSKELSTFGFEVDILDWAATENMETLFGDENYKVIIYTEAESITETLVGKVDKYVRKGGNLICIGGPAFTNVYEKAGEGYRFSRIMPGTKGTTEETEFKADIIFDCLAPAYETFPITNAVNIITGPEQAILSEGSYPIPADLFSPSPRNYATGLFKERLRRFIPLMEALDEKGEVAGYPAFMMLLECFSEENEVSNESLGSSYASFCVNDVDFISSKRVINDIATLAAHMHRGIFLYGGGTEEYAYFEGDKWRIGAEVLSREGVFNINNLDDTLTVKVKLEQNGKTLYEKEYNAFDFTDEYPVLYGQKSVFVEEWMPETSGSFTATAELCKNGLTLDKLTHETVIYEFEPEKERQYLRAEGNDLYLGDKLWKCFGVNYMPSSGITLTGNEYEKWVSDTAFAPEIVEKDLRRIKGMGMNAVSLIVYCDVNKDNNNLLYLLYLCEKYDIKAFLSIREHMDPMYYDEYHHQKFVELVVDKKLADIDTVIGYDIAWETMPTTTPSWCNVEGMQKFQKHWNEWITDNYGSIEAAEKEWGYILERDPNGEAKVIVHVRNVTDTNRKAIIAHRRWICDISAEIYGRVVDDLHDVDANHLVSSRMGMYTGWPASDHVNVGWEYSGLAAALDVMGPEGYGYYSKWKDDFEAAVFSVLYSRYSCEKPLIWFEFGKDGWSGSNFEANDSKEIVAQGEYAELVNRMLTESQSNGIFYWWYAGGYRNGEASDYGIINPDGSDRPATKVIREYAAEFLDIKPVELSKNPDKAKADAIGNGAMGLYDVFKKNMRDAYEKGEIYGIVDSAEGSTSLDTSLERLSKLDNGPIRNLNADFRRVYYSTESDGEWKRLNEGDSITVKRNEKVYIKADVVNTGIAKWISKANSGGQQGGVCVTLGRDSFNIPSDAEKHDMLTVEGIEFSVSTGKNMRMQMTAEGRSDFGEIYKFTVNVTD